MTNWEIYESAWTDAGPPDFYVDALLRLGDAPGQPIAWVTLWGREPESSGAAELIGVEAGAMQSSYGMGMGPLKRDRPIPTDVLRGIPYAQIMARGLFLLSQNGGPERPGDGEVSDGEIPASLALTDSEYYRSLRSEWPKGDIGELIGAVGDVYLQAVVAGTPTQKAVQDAFGVSRATAGRMISKARELGHITVQGAVGRPRKKRDDDNGKDRT